MDDYKKLIELLAHPADGRDNADIMISAADAIEQLVKERDAAVVDLKTVTHRHNLCDCCKHCTLPNGDDCDYGNDCEWEWRGAEEK